MKSIVLLLLFGLLLPATVSGKRIKRCRLDDRPLSERKADYRKVVEYPSGFSESNTCQQADRVEYGDSLLLIDYSPLCDFKGIGAELVQDNAPFWKLMRSENPKRRFGDFVQLFEGNFPNNYASRGFTARWLIRDGWLYLKDISLFTPDLYWFSFIQISKSKDPDSEYPARINPPNGEIRRRLEKATGRQFNADSLIRADWFSGNLVGETREYPRESHAVWIEVKEGKVESVRFKPMQPIVEKFSMRARALNQDPYLFFEEARRTWGVEPDSAYEKHEKIFGVLIE